ncbi:MAG: L,D-transpeptidase family protein [Nostocoides sp.]
MNRRTKAVVAGAVVVPLAVLGAGAAYAVHYTDKALPGSSVAGQSVAGMTRAELVASINERAQQAKVTVQAGSGPHTASLAELGYTVDAEATADAVLKANSDVTAYARALVSDHLVDVVVMTDDEALTAYAKKLTGTAGSVGTNAKVTMAKDKRSFTVVPGVAGKSVDPSSLAGVAKAAETLTPATVTANLVQVDPAVTTASAKKVADQANDLVNTDVSVAEGSRRYSATAEEKASWVKIPVTGGVPGKPTLDSAKLSSWVQEKASGATVSVTNGVRNVSSTGKVLTVLTQARDGAEVTNVDDVSKAMAGAFSAGKAYSGTFTTKTIPATWTERKIAAGAENLAYQAAEGEKWIDVNLSKHTMAAYVGGKAVFGPVAMVNGASETPSLVGTYRIDRKYSSDRMRGSNADGTLYDTPDVPWVSYFSGGYALHGAPWRSTFGYAASHGCINLPVSTAKWVFDWAPLGTPVASHF